jgi:signal transduction histidine kinase
MSQTAMIPDTPRQRGTVRWGIGACFIAMVRGLALSGMLLAALLLLLVPLLAATFTAVGAGVLVVGNGPSGDHRFLTGLALLAAGLGIGRLFVPSALLALRRLASHTRRLAGAWSGVPIAEPYQPPPDPGHGRLPFRRRLIWLASDPATWRDMLWALVSACVGWVLAALPAILAGTGLIAFIYPAVGPRTSEAASAFTAKPGGAGGTVIPAPAFPGNDRTTLLLIGTAFVLAGVASAPWLLRASFGMARSLLAPTGQAELALRVSHLAQTRSETLDGGAAEIRRIERDLHDGAQARLVAMGMTLGAAEELIESSPDAARALLAEARESSARALAELRALVRGIHPPVLADRGLADAVRALALDSGLNVQVEGALPGRPQAPVESAAYFAVSELLANVSKHASARQTWIDMRHERGLLRVDVIDDGHGGADPAQGSGLHGIERRLAAFDGILALNSPPGGPTVVTMEIPCALSSPKTSSC